MANVERCDVAFEVSVYIQNIIISNSVSFCGVSQFVLNFFFCLSFSFCLPFKSTRSPKNSNTICIFIFLFLVHLSMMTHSLRFNIRKYYKNILYFEVHWKSVWAEFVVHGCFLKSYRKQKKKIMKWNSVQIIFNFGSGIIFIFKCCVFYGCSRNVRKFVYFLN